MLLLDIEKNIIEPLSRADKEQLLKDIQKMLERERKREEFTAKLQNAKEMYISPGFEIDPEAALKLHGRMQ